MKLLLLYLSLAIAVSANSQFCFYPEEKEALYSRSMQLINPTHANWVRSTSSRIQSGRLDVSDVQAETRKYAVLGKMGESDIEALAFLVLMEASKSAQEDLKSIMAQVKASNEKRKKMRAALNALKSGQSGIRYNTQLDSLKRAGGFIATNNPGRISAVAIKPLTKADIDTALDQMKNDLDSMSEMGEMESLRLQMAMDRMSKMMSTLSNLLKKIAGTAEQITQNLK